MNTHDEVRKVKIQAWAIVETKGKNPFPIPGAPLKDVPEAMTSAVFEFRKTALLVQRKSREYRKRIHSNKIATKVVPCVITYQP